SGPLGLRTCRQTQTIGTMTTSSLMTLMTTCICDDPLEVTTTRTRSRCFGVRVRGIAALATVLPARRRAWRGLMMDRVDTSKGGSHALEVPRRRHLALPRSESRPGFLHEEARPRPRIRVGRGRIPGVQGRHGHRARGLRIHLEEVG